MGKSAKVAISLPATVLAAVERERKRNAESRSEFFRRAAERLLKQEAESRSIAVYVDGYAAMPESTREVETVHRAGVTVLAEEPW